MKVFLLQDIENVGMAGQIVSVTDGYAANFLFPRKLAQKVVPGSEAFFAQKIKKAEATAQVLSSKIAMLAEHLKTTKITVSKRIHDDGKLYGSVSAEEVVDALKAKGYSVNKKQVVFGKTIRAVGEHVVTIKLSSKLTPEITVVVAAAKE
ncbi:MAG: 50S ribosomal protein L9 [bacterium]